jgi:four helix bundle protein
MQDFKKLTVWQKSHELTLSIYTATAKFSEDEQYGLTSQFRRAAASIPANIAEGCGRGDSAELARFLRIAAGSASELEYHLILARDLNYLVAGSSESLIRDVIQIKRMLAVLQKRVLAARPVVATNRQLIAND